MATETTTTQTNKPTPEEDLPTKYAFANLPPYTHPPETSAELPWAELVTLDLADYAQPGGKARLAAQLAHAVHHVGFFYVKNFGLTQAQVDRQFTIAQALFALPEAARAAYECDWRANDYNGWRPRYTGGTGQAGVLSHVEFYNIPKQTPDYEGKYDHVQPDLIKAHLPEIKVFQRALHENVVLPLLRLFALVLQLPDEEHLAKQHAFEDKSTDHFRYMLYHPRTEAEWQAVNYGKDGGHTDLGTLTLLFRQPVVGLQILGEDNNWTYVSSQPGTITVNLADTISHLTGGWLKSSVHRVHAPPPDQLAYKRTGLLYFARPSDNTLLAPINDSPVLQAAGVQSRFEKPVTAGEWVRAKQNFQLNPDKLESARKEDGTVEILAGFSDRKYKA